MNATIDTADLIEFTDDELSTVASAVTREVERRTLEAASDAAAIIKGLECAKRALAVAATGGHSICFFGVKHSGKTMLRALGLKLGHRLTFEARPCPCGNYNDPRLTCRCSEAKVRKALDAIPQAEIYCEVQRATAREFEDAHTPTLASHILNQMKQALPKANRPTTLDKAAQSLLGSAMREFPLSPVEVQTIRKVASTIAALDRADVIVSSHVCEAVNYCHRRF